MTRNKDTVAALIFVALTLIIVFPGWQRFTSGFMCDWGDGLQNVWNLWWMHRAILIDHSWPWRTDMLWRPYGGIGLYTHSLNPFNGIIATPLLGFLKLNVVYNLIVLHTYVLGGWFAYWLGRRLTGSFWAGLAAGSIFAFSPYHYAHTIGHMQTLSLQFLPLYAMGLWGMATEPLRSRWPVIATVALVLATLCSWYYLLGCAILGILYLAWQFPFFLPGRRGALGSPNSKRIFVNYAVAHSAAALILSPVLIGMARATSHTNYIGTHSPLEFSADLAGFLIPGEISWLARWFEAAWKTFPGNMAENGYWIGIAPALLAMAALMWQRRAAAWWAFVAVAFAMLALGPRLHVFGHAYPAPLPYLAAEALLPPVRNAGIPVRFASIMYLGLAMLGAIGLREVFDRWAPASRHRAIIGVSATALIIIGYLPSHFSYIEFERPPEFYELMTSIKNEPGDFSILDAPMIGNTIGLYYQTLHERPLAMGYVSRTPRDYIDLIEPAPGLGFITRMRDQNDADADLAAFESHIRKLEIRYIFDYEIAYDDYLQSCTFLERIYSDPHFECWVVKDANSSEAPY